jgi:hypothetical protein
MAQIDWTAAPFDVLARGAVNMRSIETQQLQQVAAQIAPGAIADVETA